MMKKVGIVLTVLAVLVAITGCDVLNPQPVMSEATAHVMTLYAVLTESVLVNNLPTATPAQPTAVQVTSTAVPTAAPTNTPMLELPSVTPAPTNQPIPCYRIGSVKDVTIPDDYDKLAQGEVFVKTWRLLNNGSCNWSANVQIVFVTGAQMDGPASQAIGEAVGVGQTLDVSVTLKAPATSGRHTGYWMLKSPEGNRFGLGANSTESFWVMIVMGSGTVTPSLTKTPSTPLPTKTSTLTPTITLTRTPTLTITPVCPPYPVGMDHCP